MATHRMKHTFTAGELSPMMSMRADFDRYKNGCKALKNMYCATQGPAVRRPGFQFLDNISDLGVKHTTKYIKLPWNKVYYNDEHPGEGNLSLPESNMALRINQNDADATSQLDVLEDVKDNDIVTVYDKQDHDKYWSARVANVVRITPSFRFEVNSYNKGPKGIPADDALCEVYITIKHLELLYPVKPFRLVPFIYNETVSYVLIFCDFAPTTFAPDGGMIMFVVYKDALVTNDGTSPIYLAIPNDVTDPAHSDNLLWDIEAFDYAQAGKELYIAQKSFQPCAIIRNTHTSWSLVKYSYTDQPAEWRGPYAWPQKVVFHQQRLAYANNQVHPQTVWMSRAGDFHNFGTSATIQKDDAVTFVLASGTQNEIQWLLSAKALNIGTIGDEWTITGSTEFALTPENILAQRQTNNGSRNIKPLKVGITTLFIEKHGRVVNEFVYDYTYDSYKTSDLAVLSPHITEQYSITDWAFQKTPDSIIWCVKEDGSIAAITYQRQHKVVGWHQHETDGDFLNIATIPGNTREDDVYVLVEREHTYDSHTGLWQKSVYLEKMEDQFKEDEAAWGRFLDSHLVYVGTFVNTLSGLDHLESKTVHILADGTVHPPVVVAGGKISLNNLYSHIVVGLQYVSEVRPLVSDVGLKDGTAFGRVQRVTNVDVDLYRSLGVYLGREDTEDGESEEEHAFRVPGDLMGKAVPLFTGIKHIAFPEGFDRKTEYFIRQYQPLPLIVRGVIDTIEVYE